MTDDPKPCPFCGNPVAPWWVLPLITKGWTEYKVTCRNCGATGPNDVSEERAKEMWNMRRQRSRIGSGTA